jgi:hypothetical protein
METWESIRLRCRRDGEKIKPLARDLEGGKFAMGNHVLHSHLIAMARTFTMGGRRRGVCVYLQRK